MEEKRKRERKSKKGKEGANKEKREANKEKREANKEKGEANKEKREANKEKREANKKKREAHKAHNKEKGKWLKYFTPFYLTLVEASEMESLRARKDRSERIPALNLDPGRAEPPVFSFLPDK